MGADEFELLPFRDVYAKENYHGDTLVRTTAVVRHVSPIDSQRFIAYLGPEWLSQVSRPGKETPVYQSEFYRRLRSRTPSIPIVGYAQEGVGLERVMKPLIDLVKTRTPVEIGGWCVYQENKQGSIYTDDPKFQCMHLAEFPEMHELPAEMFARDGAFLYHREELLAIVHMKNLQL
jgi:hypothetical protein